MEATLETQSDWELLREYAATGSEAAFSVLVHRHLDFVYSVAFRYCSDPGMAEEVANNVFSILARKASTLKKDTVLLGWLFKTARFAAANARGFQKRRRQWEEQAARMGRMHQQVREQNIYRWAGLLLAELSRIPEEAQQGDVAGGGSAAPSTRSGRGIVD